MPLKRKLLLSMLTPAVLLLLVGVSGVYALRHLEQSAGRILADNYQSIKQASLMEHALWRLRSADGESGSDAGARDRSEWAAAFEEALENCEANITESGEVKVLSRMREHWTAVKAELVEGARARPHENGPLPREVELLHADVEELIALNEQAMADSERETRSVARTMLLVMTGSAFVAMIALAMFALISARRISRPVSEVADRLHRAFAADADDAAAPAAGPGDEIARLRHEVDSLLERLGRYEDEQNRQLSHLQGRLALVMSEVLEGLVLLDRDFEILATNRVAGALIGAECAVGTCLNSLSLPRDLRDLLAPLFADGLKEERDLGKLRREVDGAERFYRPRVLPVTAADGSVDGYLLLFWDVTEEQRFEESRRRFIAMLSHQLKTPMTSLSMSVNLLKERSVGDDPARAELLNIVADSCSNLSALVSDLVDAAREAHTDLGLAPKRVDVVGLLRSTLRPLTPQAEQVGIELELPAGDQRIVASVDPVKFPWVVANIAGNALRYTGSGGHIRVGVSERDGAFEVSIRDNGIGIARENLERVFQPLVTLDDDRSPGTRGLGLAIAREIVEAHGGTISADSEIGQWTEFTIRIPV